MKQSVRELYTDKMNALSTLLFEKIKTDAFSFHGLKFPIILIDFLTIQEYSAKRNPQRSTINRDGANTNDGGPLYEANLS